MEPIRVLYVNGGIMHRGGIEAYMMNYYRHIDRKKVQIDFVVHGFEKGVYDDEIREMGGKIYNVPIKSKDYIGNIRALKAIFNTGEYKIIHSHMDAMSMVVLKIAKQCGVPIRIAHSHNTQHLTNSKIKYMLNEYARRNINKYATHLFACSEAAGRWLFGNAKYDSGDVVLVNNAIEIEKFQFNEAKRELLRQQLGLSNNFVIGHVGRFDYQKNHLFLLNIFQETLKYIPNAKLVLIGEGHLKEKITKKIRDLEIEERVMMLGLRSDVNDLNNMFDIFLLPSLFEGLPVVAIEAQANGLPCLFSDTITKEVQVTDLVKFMSKEQTALDWGVEINRVLQQNNIRRSKKNILISNGYSIEDEAQRLENMYISLIEE